MLWRVERITGRFLVIVVSVSALMALLVAGAVAWMQFDAQRLRLDSYMSDIARLNAMALADPMWTINDRASRSIVGSLGVHPEIACAEVIEPDGAVLTATRDGGCGEPADAARIIHTVAYEGHALGDLVLWVNAGALYESARADIAHTILVFLLLTGAMAVTAVFAFRATVMIPLDRLLGAIRGAGKVSVNPRPEDELGRVITAYNGLLDRVAAHTAEIEATRAHAVAAAQAKSRFLATMSHEIRTPMHGVLGTVELLRETPLAPNQRRYADIILHSTEALLGIINDILDLSKIEAGKVHMTPAPTNPGRIAQEVVGALAASARSKGLDLTLTQAADLPAWILADPQRLRQVVMNLLGNAVKFTEAGSVTVSLASHGGDLTITVADTGIGIAPEILSHLFQPFHQGDDSTTRRHGGTGLGLSISSQLVELMGGRIEVDSVPGQGSVFRIVLPFEEVASPPSLPEPPPRPAANVAGGRILAAEDNPVNQWLLRSQLGKLGYEVDIHPDGRTALAAFAAGGYQAVVTDYHMPIMDGNDLARAIRAAEKGGGRRIPIIGMTADAFAETVEDCLRAGMDLVVTKPVSLEDLGRVLDCLIGGVPAAAEAVPVPERVAEAETDAPLLDHAMMDALFGDDAAGRADMAALFGVTTDELMAVIARAESAADTVAMAEAAHSLASAALSLGATRMGLTARALELAMQAGEWAQAPGLLARLRALDAETRRVLAADVQA